jgi:hypothetical protein
VRDWSGRRCMIPWSLWRQNGWIDGCPKTNKMPNALSDYCLLVYTYAPRIPKIHPPKVHRVAPEKLLAPQLLSPQLLSPQILSQLLSPQP